MKRTKKQILNGCTKDVQSSKVIANNTLRINYTDGTEAVRLHDTDVVTKETGGIFCLNSGGWRTLTTKERINRYSPARLYQRKGLWYIGEVVFFDGIKVNEAGEVVGKVVKVDDKKINDLKKKIKGFTDLITKENLPLPSSGDCWYCCMRTESGETLGDSFKDYDHLFQHLEEGYLHGSILVNAMREAGYRDEQIGLHFSLKLADTFKRAVRKYLQKRLIANIAVK